MNESYRNNYMNELSLFLSISIVLRVEKFIK